MKLAVVGSRGFTDYALATFILNEYMDISGGSLHIISGGARGADSLAVRFAVDNSLPLITFLPDWERYGKSAGYIRNADIVKTADELIAFWDSKSKGTLHSINLARKQGKTVVVIEYEKLKLA